MKYSLCFVKRIPLFVIVILLAMGASVCVGGPSHTNDAPDGDDGSVFYDDTATNEYVAHDYHGIDMSSEKIDGLLRMQVREKIRWLEEGPQDYCLPEVRWAAEKGMYYLETHQTVIYFEQTPTSAQVEDLQQLGVVLDLAKWCPPVGNHPHGFLWTAIPIHAIDELASRCYIIRLVSNEGFIETCGNIGGVTSVDA